MSTVRLTEAPPCGVTVTTYLPGGRLRITHLPPVSRHDEERPPPDAVAVPAMAAPSGLEAETEMEPWPQADWGAAKSSAAAVAKVMVVSFIFVTRVVLLFF